MQKIVSFFLILLSITLHAQHKSLLERLCCGSRKRARYTSHCMRNTAIAGIALGACSQVVTIGPGALVVSAASVAAVSSLQAWQEMRVMRRRRRNNNRLRQPQRDPRLVVRRHPFVRAHGMPV